MKEVQFIPKDAKEISILFLANHIQLDLVRFISPFVFIRFVPNTIEVFATDNTEGIWCFQYHL